MSALPGAILVSQRVAIDHATGERRDALDQNWTLFVRACEFLAIPVPNLPATVDVLWEHVRPVAVLLSGGNDPGVLGGDAPERDETEQRLIALAIEKRVPLVGVCRGMQMIQLHFGCRLHCVPGHVGVRWTISFDGKSRSVNSFHRFGASESVEMLNVVARAEDGVIKAVRARHHLATGVMWHPERETPFAIDDIHFMSRAFRGRA